MSDATTEWLKSGEYLPPFMRDFHDQKDVFKTLQEVVERRNAKDGRGSYTADLTWITAHVYTVDVFLWIMARHGYTLQRSRKRVPFADIWDWLKGGREERQRAYGAMLRERLATGTAEPAAEPAKPNGMNQNEVSPDPDEPLAGPKARPRPNAEPSAA